VLTYLAYHLETTKKLEKNEKLGKTGNAWHNAWSIAVLGNFCPDDFVGPAAAAGSLVLEHKVEKH